MWVRLSSSADHRIGADMHNAPNAKKTALCLPPKTRTYKLPELKYKKPKPKSLRAFYFNAFEPYNFL